MKLDTSLIVQGLINSEIERVLKKQTKVMFKKEYIKKLMAAKLDIQSHEIKL